MNGMMGCDVLQLLDERSSESRYVRRMHSKNYCDTKYGGGWVECNRNRLADWVEGKRPCTQKEKMGSWGV